MKFMYSAGDQPLAGYTIKRAIHRGGFGEVYYARTDAGKDVALKLLHDHREIELRGVSQCMNLKHPQLVTIFDIKTDAEGDHWIVMEYMAGPTLAERLQQYPQGMPPEMAYSIFQQLAQGLEFLHSRSLVHRDLKPANIFLEANEVKIGDVGLSKFIGPSHRSAQTQSVGTVHYMAPEVARGRYGQGVDLYALGIILFEMLTGRVPFEGESTAEILLKHLTQPPDLSAVDPRFRDLLARALHKEELLRFITIQEFQKAFTRVMTNAGSHSSSGAGVEYHEQVHRHRNQQERGAVCPKGQRLFLPPDGSWWWLVASVILLMMTMHHLPRTAGGFRYVGLAIVAGAAYYCYRRLNAVPVATHAPVPVASQYTPTVASPRAISPQVGTPGKQQIPVHHKPAPFIRSGQEQLVALLQSLAIVPLILLLIAGTILLFSRDFFASKWHPAGLDVAHFGFFVASATLISWALLTINQWFRRRQPDFTLKKLSLLTVGAATGLGVFGLGEWLFVQYPPHLFPEHSHGLVSHVGRFDLAATKLGGIGQPLPLESPKLHWEPVFEPEVDHRVGTIPPKQHRVAMKAIPQDPERIGSQTVSSWNPTAAGYAVFFAMLFSLRAWDRLMDFKRETRMAWISIAISAGLAYLICCIFTFPAIWGITWAATVTAAVQLASPCVQNR